VRRLLISFIAISFLLPSSQTVALAQGGFFTDIQGNTHEDNINRIAEAGITLGVGGGKYDPRGHVSRAQMASFLARAFELPPASRDYFTDDTGSTHEDSINRVAEAGITLGIGGGKYDPGSDVTREQMASFLARAMGLTPIDGNRFSDVSGTHAANINAVAAAGVTLGCDAAGTRFCPRDPVRRDQMASFLARALGLGAHPRSGDHWDLLGCSNTTGTCTYRQGGWVRLEARRPLVRMQPCQLWDHSVIPPRCLIPGVLDAHFRVLDPAGAAGVPGQSTYIGVTIRYDERGFSAARFQFPLHPDAPTGSWTGLLCRGTQRTAECEKLLTVHFEVVP
jgi:hypothetical protein